MYNWSTDEKKLKKNPETYTLWRLEQLINFGLRGEKINKKALKKYWDKIRIDPARRNFLKKILWVPLEIARVNYESKLLHYHYVKKCGFYYLKTEILASISYL